MNSKDPDGWGVEPPADAPNDPRPAPTHAVGGEADYDGDGWGVEPTRAERDAAPTARAGRPHTLGGGAPAERAKPREPAPPGTRLAATVLGAIILLVGGRVAINAYTAEDPGPPARVPVIADAAPDPDAARDAAAPPVSDALPDGERTDARVALVDVTLNPVPADIVRVRDGVTICRATRRCALAIDLDYDARAPGHAPYRIDGDALYDRRRSGQMTVTLSPAPTERRR